MISLPRSTQFLSKYCSYYVSIPYSSLPEPRVQQQCLPVSSYRRHIKLTYDYHIGTVVVFLRTKRRAWSGMWSTVLVPIYTVSLSLSSGAACFGSRYEPNADTATAATTSCTPPVPEFSSCHSLYTLFPQNWNFLANLLILLMCFNYQTYLLLDPIFNRALV